MPKASGKAPGAMSGNGPERKERVVLISLIERHASEELLALIEDINRVQMSVWGLAFIKRRALRLMTNEEFILAIKPALEDVTEAKVFVLDNGDIYITWRGMQKRVHEQLCTRVKQTLLRHQEDGPESPVTYFDPQVMGNEIITLLRAQLRSSIPPAASPVFEKSASSKNIPKPNAVQTKKFYDAIQERGSRKQLKILVVEDQQLLRRLLHEVLRGEHAVESVAGLHEGWNLYLEKAPDVAFLDIGLADGNGHDLARAIKQIDPDSCVVMVTANNTPDEIEAARFNHANGFVAKPYSKNQIFTCIDRYIGARRLAAARDKYV
jgi:CheY-like chemotaxis protein